MRTPLHIASYDRPAPGVTALTALCGCTYAQRDPATGEVWYAALACPPTAFPTWEATWGQRPGATPVCPQCRTIYTTTQTAC